MRTRRRKKKLLKPINSCRYGRCITPRLPESERCGKHQSTPHGFTLKDPSATIESQKEGDIKMMKSLTPFGKSLILLLFVLVLLSIAAVSVYQQSRIDKLESRVNYLSRPMLTITPTPLPTESVTPAAGLFRRGVVITATPSAMKGVSK